MQLLLTSLIRSKQNICDENLYMLSATAAGVAMTSSGHTTMRWTTHHHLDVINDRQRRTVALLDDLLEQPIEADNILCWRSICGSGLLTCNKPCFICCKTFFVSCFNNVIVAQSRRGWIMTSYCSWYSYFFVLTCFAELSQMHLITLFDHLHFMTVQVWLQ